MIYDENRRKFYAKSTLRSISNDNAEFDNDSVIQRYWPFPLHKMCICGPWRANNCSIYIAIELRLFPVHLKWHSEAHTEEKVPLLTILKWWFCMNGSLLESDIKTLEVNGRKSKKLLHWHRKWVVWNENGVHINFELWIMTANCKLSG